MTIQTTPLQPLTYTIPTVCALGNFSRAWLYLQWKAGAGPRKFKLGSKTLIMASEFHSWLDAKAAA